MGRWTGLSNLIDFHFEHSHSHHSSYRNGLRLSTRYHKLDDSIFVFCRSCGNSMKTEELSKMAAYTGSTPTTRVRSSNPKHFLTWSATVANNRIQKLSKNFVNNVSKLHNKMEKVMPVFHSPSPNCQTDNEQVENDLSEPYNKDRHQIHEACRISKVHKIPLSSSRINCEKNDYKTGSRQSEGLSCSNVDDDDEDANEERYSGFTPPSSTSYRAQGQEILSNVASTTLTASSTFASSSGSALMITSKTGGGVGNAGATATTTGPGFPHQIQVQSARIVQSHPLKQDATATASGNKIHKNLVQSGHYKIPPNPMITAEALKAMIINSPSELNSYCKYDEKPQPIKYVEVDVNTDMKNSVELRTIQHENQSKYNSSCGSGSSGTSTSNNMSVSDERCSSPLRNNASLPINSPQWSRTSSLSTQTSSNAHNIQMPTSILKNPLTNVENDYDKRSNITACMTSSRSSTNVDEISSQGIDNEGLTVTDHKPATTVSFSSPVIESSDKASLLIKGKKSFTKRVKSNKNTQGNTKNNNNNDKRAVAFQNPLSGSTSGSNRKHGSSVSPEAYPPSQLAVTIFEQGEADLRHAPWFQAGIPRDIALEVLKNEPIGSFIVRESTTFRCFALSLRVPKEFKRLGIAHYLILKSVRGYKIKGFTKEFKTLNSLITHHSVMQELLPCPLSLHRYHPNYPQKISRFNSSDFIEPEKLVGFTNFVDCLEKS